VAHPSGYHIPCKIRKLRYIDGMVTQTLSLKLPFLRLNATKAADFARLQDLNTAAANRILDVPKEERAALTTAHFGHVLLGSAWMNQTIRNARAKTGVKRFKVLPLETNNQNWTLHKVGDTYSLGFGLLRGVKKRVPLDVYGAHATRALDALLAGTAKKGGLKLWRSRRGHLVRARLRDNGCSCRGAERPVGRRGSGAEPSGRGEYADRTPPFLDVRGGAAGAAALRGQTSPFAEGG